MKSRMDSGPLPNQRFAQQVADIAMPPLFGSLSGEVTVSVMGQPLGQARFDGAVVGVHAAVLASGKDDTNALSATFDVKINGVSIFTTQPAIAHVSGEASQQKTTLPEAGDTGITDAVINASAAEFSAGDLINWDFKITRTNSPTTEMNSPSIMVELRPNSG
ncbi:MAG: hypothetical protein ACWGQW_02425 [bacterium]